MSDVFVLDEEGNIKQSGGSAGVTDHGVLTGLSDDDHSQYLLVDGSRAMSGDLELGSNELIATEQGSTPSTPATNKRKLYPKADGWYDLDDTGEENGPLGGGGALPFNFRQGLAIKRLAADQVCVESGAATVESALVEKIVSTALDLTTAGNWIGGSSLEAASSWVNVYVDASGNLKLHDTLPIYPVANTDSRVATMQVNEAGWDGSDAAHGLNATIITYDNDSGEGNIVAGMYVIIADDSACTTGRGKGIGASASKNSLSFALITARDTGANTITVEAGHQIAINDDDYLFVVEAGAPIFNYIGSTWYRWLGALWNDSVGDLTDNDNTQAQYVVDEASDYTTTSTSFVPVDSTKLVLPLVICGDAVDINFIGAIENSIAESIWYLDVFIDDASVSGDDGITADRQPVIRTGEEPHNTSVNFTKRRLLPGSHDFGLYWKVQSGGTAKLFAGAGTSTVDLHPQFSVAEVS